MAEKKSQHRWNTSAETLLHVKEREERWEEMSVNERKKINKVISRSARNDYRNFVEDVLEDIDREDQAGNTREVYRLAKQLKPKSGN